MSFQSASRDEWKSVEPFSGGYHVEDELKIYLWHITSPPDTFVQVYIDTISVQPDPDDDRYDMIWFLTAFNVVSLSFYKTFFLATTFRLKYA